MRRHILISAFLLFVSSFQLFSSNFEIKSLRVYSSEDETSFPILNLSNPNSNSLAIEFDIKAENEPSLMIVFRPCDSNWNPYESPFLVNPLYDKEPNIWLDKLPLSIKGARYHYLGNFPNNNVQFNIAGKWIFYITDAFDKEKIYATGKFFVILSQINVTTQVVRESLQGNYGDLAILGKTLAIKTNFVLPDSLIPANVIKVEVYKNRMINQPIIIDRLTTTQETYYEWDAGRKFSFIARNIKPGNEYRETDTRNVSKYNSMNVQARFGEFDQSNLFSKRNRDFNGGSLLMNWRNENAGYLNVLFRLKAPESVSKPIFVVGAFTDWKVLPEYEMFDDNGMMNLTVPLKRGLYDYQYVAADVDNGLIKNIDWEILEGNFFETRNEYYVFVFYAAPEKGGYEKIIGFKNITGEL